MEMTTMDPSRLTSFFFQRRWNDDVLLGRDQDDFLWITKKNAEFAPDMCRSEPFVLSRGKENSIVLCSIHDHISNLAIDEAGTNGGKSPKAYGIEDKPPAESPETQARAVFQRH